MSSYEHLLVEHDDGVTWVSLNRPEVRNAVNEKMQKELRDVWTKARYDNDVRCLVLTGEGKAFCTGADRAEAVNEENSKNIEQGIYPGYPTPWVYDDPGRDIGPKSCDLWKPVIAAVHGMACAAAFYMLGETDFIIASEDATFFDPHVTYGMTAAYEPTHMLTKMPFPELVRLYLMGNYERMSAQRAHEIGLVSEVTPVDELRERAGWAAHAIAEQPTLAIQGTLRALWTAQELSRSQAIALASLYTRIGTDAAEFRAGDAKFSSGKRIEWRLR